MSGQAVERRGWTPAEFGAMYGLSDQAVRRLIRRGELGAIPVGRKRLITAQHRSAWEARRLAA